jgi:hypothetical protein
MAVITRSTKTTSGTTEFTAGTNIDPDEVNTDFNDLFTLQNGNISNTNISDVAWSKVTGTPDPEDIDDTSGTDAEQDVVLDPGHYLTRAKAADLEDEIQQLRYAIARLSVGVDTLRWDTGSAANEAVNWIEQPARGENLVPNGHLNVFTGTSGTDPPDLWEWVVEPVTSHGVSDASTAEGKGREFNFVGDAAGQGIKNTVSGLRASTKYLFEVRAKAQAGDQVNITTVGAGGATWENANSSISAASDGADTYVTKGFVIETDATPTDIQLKLTTNGTTDDITVLFVSLRELGNAAETLDSPGPLWAEIRKNGSQAISSTTTAGELVSTNSSAPSTSDLETSLVVPDVLTYALKVTATVTLERNSSANDFARVYIRIDDGTNVIEWPLCEYDQQTGASHIFRVTKSLARTVYPVTPGLTYTVDMRAAEDASGTQLVIFGDADGASAGSLSSGTSSTGIEIELVRIA